MGWSGHFTIKHRLTALMMLISLSAVTLVSVAIIFYQRAWQTQEMVRRFLGLAEVVSLNSRAALTFKDQAAATATLAALGGEKELISATLFNREGELFAQFQGPHAPTAGATETLTPPPLEKPPIQLQEGFRFTTDRLLVWKPVTLEGETIGAVYLEVSLHQLRAVLWGDLKITLLTVLLALGLAYPLSLVFQNTISSPILNLARTMKTISQDQNFRMRAVKERADELGDLVDCFNDMLAQLEQRDEALARHQEHLEEEVARRTAELSRTNEELEQAIQELRESEHHLTALMESLGAGVVIVDPAVRRLVYANSYAANMVGVPREQLRGVPCHRYFHTGQGNLCPILELGEAGFRREDFLINAQGESVPILKNVVTIQRKGRTYFIETFFDLTELKKVEAELRRSKEAAEAASRAKSQFLANMSHEIRTPLHGIIGMTELLQTTPLSESQQRLVATARNSAFTLLNLLDDILDFSKIEVGKLKLEHLEFDLLQAVEEVVEMFAETANNKNLDYFCTMTPEVPRKVMGDPLRLRQIIMNLLSNAVKFTSKGEVLTRVSVLYETKDMVVVLFEVQDTGPGIEPEAQKLIFQEFYQADGSTTRKFGGTGLGLAIARRLVHLMGGEIGVTSTPGQGSRFWFTVRLSRGASLSERPRDHASLLKGLKVLVVNSSPSSREALAQQLTYWGLECQAVADGASALMAVRQAFNLKKPYQLAVIDQNLPDMGGLTLARTLKADPATSAIPLIMLVSLDQSTPPLKEGPPGPEVLLRKPIRLSQLYNALLELVLKASFPPAPPGKTSLPPSPPRFTGTILVVEDNPVNQDVVRAMLEYLGCKVEVATSGREALGALACRPYDLVFMDCQMPDLDGYEVTRQFRQQEQERASVPRTPIVALTAHVLEAERQKCKAVGMDDYLGKPFTMAELEKILQRWLLKESPSPAGFPPGSAGLSEKVPSRSEGIEGNEPECEAHNPVLDPKILEGLRALEGAGRPGLLERLIRNYAVDSEALLKELKEAVGEKNGEALRRLAHRFKSSSAQLGATGLAELCKKLEVLAKEQSLDEAPELFQQISQEHARVMAVLAQELPENKT